MLFNSLGFRGLKGSVRRFTWVGVEGEGLDCTCALSCGCQTLECSPRSNPSITY